MARAAGRVFSYPLNRPSGFHKMIYLSGVHRGYPEIISV